MPGLRQEIAALIDKHGGAMTTAELTAAVLGARGSVADAPQRSQAAAAVACAAVDTKMSREAGRYTLHRCAHRLLIMAISGLADGYTASPVARAQYAKELGCRADAIAAADPIPEPPLLDDLLREAGIELVWDRNGADGRGCYHPRNPLREPSSTATTLPRHSTALQSGLSLSPDVDAARALEGRLTAALTEHRFLMLTVAQRHLLRAEDEIMRRSRLHRAHRRR